VVLACYNALIPHICPEVPEAQAEAIRYAVKVPLVYLSVAVRNWKAWDELGFHSIYAPQSSYMHSFGLDFPVSIGDYRFTRGPAAPTVLHGAFVPTEPDKGLSDKQQSSAGRQRLDEMSYDDHEALILDQLEGALGPGGFDAERDIAAITVNRWPHGYAYEYNHLYEPSAYSPLAGPHVAGRARIGRISIANSDSSAYAYVNGAIDAADRAVDEQIAQADQLAGGGFFGRPL
jgi:spermidine dehydrogenase